MRIWGGATKREVLKTLYMPVTVASDLTSVAHDGTRREVAQWLAEALREHRARGRE